MKKIYAVLTLVFCILSSPVMQAQAAKYSSLEVIPYKIEGRKYKIGLKLNLDPGWQTYWKVPGESGAKPVFNWSKSENISFLKVEYPAPKRFSSMGIESLGYDDSEVVFPTTVYVSDTDKPVMLSLQVEIYVCKKLCVPEKYNINTKIDKSSFTKSSFIKIQKAFAKLPVQLKSDKVKAAWLSSGFGGVYINFALDIDHKLSDDFDLFIEDAINSIVDKPIVASIGNIQHIKAKLRYVDKESDILSDILNNNIRLTLVDGDKSYEFLTIFNNTPFDFLNINGSFNLKMVLWAFLGGLILNLMPCVLPVISIKTLSVLKKFGAHKGEIFKSFIVSSAGIVFS